MPRKIRRHRAKGSEQAMKTVRAQRGLDRKDHFENGGTLVAWMGGPRTKTKNLKAWNDKRLGRKKVTVE